MYAACLSCLSAIFERLGVVFLNKVWVRRTTASSSYKRQQIRKVFVLFDFEINDRTAAFLQFYRKSLNHYFNVVIIHYKKLVDLNLPRNLMHLLGLVVI